MKRLRELRTKQGLSQTDLAARAGWGKSRVCDIESGRVPNPNLKTMQTVADALGVEVYDLLVMPTHPAERSDTVTL